MSSSASLRTRAEPPGPGESWTVLRLILWAAGWLEERGVPEPRLDAEHLLAHALDTPRLQLYLDFERPLGPDELADFKPLLLRRGEREPLQYVLGRASFRELDLVVDRRVLIPRPETEVLVEAVLEAVGAGAGRGGSGAVRVAERASASERALTALDVGTGSGCVALSLAAEGPFGRVVATDSDPAALEVARENRAAAGLEEAVDLREGSLFGPVEGERFDVVVSNPPYVAEGEAESLQPEVRDWEPARALFAGPEGLDVLEALVAGAGGHLGPGGLLALEVGLGQADAVRERIARAGGWDEARVRRDLSGRERVVLARRSARPGHASAGR